MFFVPTIGHLCFWEGASDSIPKESPQDEWRWEVPDLSEGWPWNIARIDSLLQVVKDLPDGDIHFVNGLDVLEIHRENYTIAGPKPLQLLWWEFQPEHWEAL
jgi:hypothetical protein